MSTVAIPAWNGLGLLPPIDTELPTHPQRSPYPVTLLDVVMRFSTTAERRRVLAGFLDYRAALHQTGIVEGFQWLDGSFMEEVEILERRAPRDIDVVTFFCTPADFAPSDADFAALDHDAAKALFYVDSYMVGLNELSPNALVVQSAYWYSMWSHRRNQAWKGFLQIDLAACDDVQAKQWLAQFNTAKELS
jgi:hypothetical protein